MTVRLDILAATLAMIAMPVFAEESGLLQRIAADRATHGIGLTVVGEDDWLFLRSELRHVGVGRFWGDRAVEVSLAARPDRADPLPAILAYQDRLEAVGVELVIVPVPAKAFVYPDKLGDLRIGETGLRRLDHDHREFLDILETAGVTVVDLLPEFLNLRASGEQVYLRSDSHWAPSGMERAAAFVADTVRGAIPETIRRQSFSTSSYEVSLVGDLISDERSDQASTEHVTVRGITGPAGSGTTGGTSPVLIIADSHGLVFHDGGEMFASNAGFPDHLAYELQMPVDLIAVRGSAATPARVAAYRRARSDPDYLQAKRVVIWLFSVREYTEGSGWADVPVE